MNVKDSIKKVGAVAASTLMVGMTMGAAQSLSEFPGMFVDDEGSPTAQVVVGSQGAVSDVVGAVNVAAALGQATIQTSEQTETVDVEGAGGVGWEATEGVTLDTGNDDLYFGDALNSVRETLTDSDLDMLAETTFRDDSGSTTDITHYLNVGDQTIDFEKNTDALDNQDPALHVEVPAESDVTASTYVANLQASFDDSIDFTSEDVAGEDIELFNREYTVAGGMSSGEYDSDEIVLFGASEEYDLETGESTELEIDGQTVSLEVRAVTGSNEAAFYLDGSLEDASEDETFNIPGTDTDLRVDNIIQTSNDNSEGLVSFSVGSEELHLSNNAPIEDGDGDEYDGTYVQFDGGDISDPSSNPVSSIDVYLGSEDSDADTLLAGESWSHDLFENVNVRFGGLTPDAAEGEGDMVGEVGFGSTGDETATVSIDDGSDSATVEFFHEPDADDVGAGVLADDDNDAIVVEEGALLAEDQYFTSDAGDFAHMWEVRNIDRDATAGNIQDTDEAEIDLRDAVTGRTVTVDLDAVQGSGTPGYEDTANYYAGSEIIDGQKYFFALEGHDDGTSTGSFNDDTDEPQFQVAWGDSADFVSDADLSSTDGVETGDQQSLYTALDTDSGASVAFHEKVDLATGLDASTSTGGNVWRYTEELELPSTESTSDQTVNVTFVDDDTGSGNYQVLVDGEQALSTSSADSTTIDVGGVTYTLDVTSGSDYDLSIGAADPRDDSLFNQAAAVVLEPENEDDVENAFVVAPGVDDSDNEVGVGDTPGEGQIFYTGDWSDVQLEDDDDMYEDYTVYGTHTVRDSDDQGSFTLHIPHQQSVAGAAVTAADGSLETGGSGTTSGEVTYTGVTNEDIRGALPDLAKTDDQVTQSDRQNSHMILVGGPSVNTLVNQLAEDGDTWTQDEWRNEHVDEALLQVVEDAFSDGNHAMIVAGHSADDTRAAARYISEYASHQDTLEEAGMQYSPSSQEAPR